MSDETQGPAAKDEPPEDPSGMGPQVGASIVERYAIAQKAEGILAPVLTALLAFFVGGLVVLVTTGKNPLTTYKAIFDGSGLNWLLPWVTGADRVTAALNFQQTLLITTPLILTGLAVAFAFRCGMFNIGGQGQYLVGSFFAIWIGTSFSGLNPFLHIMMAIVVAMVAGAAWAGIAGFLKATVGAHEVISTIMLNWVAIWVGKFLFGLGGPLQNDQQAAIPISNTIDDSAKLPVFWGDPDFQGLSIGIFIAIAALFVYWIILNRTTLGYGVKAVGFNPEASRYGGISVCAQLLPRDGDLRNVRRPRRRARRARLAVPDRDERHHGVADRVRRHCGRASRAEHRRRRRVLGAALRRSRERHVDAQSRPEHLPAASSPRT